MVTRILLITFVLITTFFPSATKAQTSLTLEWIFSDEGRRVATVPATPAREVLAWPQSFDPSGRRALYVFNGDLFVLELSTARFSRITRTSEEERSGEFSRRSG